MDKGGVLLYKCRLCGCVERNPHVPDVFTAVGHLAVGLKLPEKWFGAPACVRHPHFCSDGRIGVADLIGGEHDKVESRERNDG